MRLKSKVSIVFISLMLILTNLELRQDNIYNSIDNLVLDRNLNVKTSSYWNNFSFIHIAGDNWSVVEAYDWVSGSGTSLDPYHIENITINGNESTSCIFIENSMQNGNRAFRQVIRSLSTESF